MELELLRQNFESAGQGHVFKYFNELDEAEKNTFLKQLEQIDLREIDELKATLLKGNSKIALDFSKLEPAPFKPLPQNRALDEEWRKAKEVGEEAIRAGRLAAFVVAGGQGTRLGFNAPKGLYKITPVMNKSLFNVFAEKILSASRKYGVRIPWLIMTSHINDAATRAYFEENSFFGLNRDDVIFFTQGLMPAVDSEGKFILEDKGKIVMTPDGHGGCLRAMCRSGAIAELDRRGIDCISYFQVDNPLVDIIDPYFLGFHILGKSEMSSKMIPKAYPSEKVGHFCVLDGKYCVVEYSDLPKEYQEMRNADGSLKFVAGSVAIHILDTAFVSKLGGGSSTMKLPFHRADKKIPYLDSDGKLVKPEKPNGVKFEMFVFDALPMAKSPVIIEGARADEFSPVKNAEGLDSPQTCKKHQKAQFARWLKAAGENIEVDSEGVPSINVEVSPLFASNVSDFVERWKALNTKPKISDGLYIA